VEPGLRLAPRETKRRTAMPTTNIEDGRSLLKWDTGGQQNSVKRDSVTLRGLPDRYLPTEQTILSHVGVLLGTWGHGHDFGPVAESRISAAIRISLASR